MILQGRGLRRLLGILCAGALLLFLARLFVVDVLRVVEQSMWPALAGGGDRVLVERWRREPERFEIWAFEGPGGALFVKRVLALAGEAFALRAGDLWLRDASGAEVRALRAPRLAELMSVRQPGPSAADTARWTVLRGSVQASRQGGLEWQGGDGFEGVLRGSVEPGAESVLDDFTGNEGLAHPGKHVVTDTSLQVVLFPVEGRLELLHEIHGDVRGIVLEGDSLRSLDGAPLGTVATAGREVRLATLDGAFSIAECGPGGAEDVLRTPRDTLAGRGLSRWRVRGSGRAHMRPVDLRRDVHYFFDGAMGAIAGYQVGANACFLAGDNQSVSVDSRTNGPVALDRLRGCVTRILWPRLRAGRLD